MSHLRTLRRIRRTDPRASRDRRAVDWRLRADRRRTSGDGRHRRVVRLLPGVLGNESSAWADSFRPACSNIRNIPGRPCSAAGMCRRCCCPAIMGGSRSWRRRQSLLRTLETAAGSAGQAESYAGGAAASSRKAAPQRIRNRRPGLTERDRCQLKTVVVFEPRCGKISNVVCDIRTVRCQRNPASRDAGELV